MSGFKIDIDAEEEEFRGVALKSCRKVVMEQKESEGASDLCQRVLSLSIVVAVFALHTSSGLGLTVPAVFEEERGGKCPQPWDRAAWYWPALPRGLGGLQSRRAWDFHT